MFKRPLGPSVTPRDALTPTARSVCVLRPFYRPHSILCLGKQPCFPVSFTYFSQCPPDLPESRACHCLFRCQVMSDSFVTPWTVAHQAPLSMGFSRQEYWSGMPFSPPGDLLDPGIKPTSPALQVDSLPSEPPGLGHYFSPHHE